LYVVTPVISIASDFYTDTLVERAQNLKLSQHPVWHKLVHYEKASFEPHRFNSAIRDDGFFKSSDGSTNPQSELEATIRGVMKPLIIGDNKHTQCEFPARFSWLKKMLNIPSQATPVIECPAFHKWTLKNSIKSVSIIYASGFLGNPASYYGHILLKLNSKNLNGNTRLFDPSVNYGAIVPSDEDPLTYMAKGIFGGYEGGFSQADYYFHNHNYGELELRNLWEYEVNLTQPEVDFVVAHAWEVIGKPYTYYFFRQNCAYRLAEMLEIVDGVRIIPNNPLFTLPRALLQNMVRSEINGQPLVRDIKYRPSREARFYDKFDILNESEKKELNRILGDVNQFGSTQYNALPAQSKSKVVDALIDYYQFGRIAELLPEKDADEGYHAMVKERFRLPVSSHKKSRSIVEPPHSGRKSSQVRFGLSFNESLGNGTSLLLRPAYYDVLDATSGQVKNSALSMGESKLFLRSGSIHINYLDILKIESINSVYSKPSVNTGSAWNIKLGVRQKDLSCLNCLVARFEGDYGYTKNVNRNMLIGAYGGAGVQDNQEGSGNIFVRASVFSHIQVTNNLNMRLSFELPKQIDGAGGMSSNYIVEARQRLGVNADLRLIYEKNKTSQLSIYTGYYF